MKRSTCHPELDSGSLIDDMGMKESYIYILSNKNKNVLYIGMTSNLLKRIVEHKESKGSAFTNKYQVHNLLYFERFTDINQAIAREKQLKNWKRAWKIELIKKINPGLEDLYSKLSL